MGLFDFLKKNDDESKDVLVSPVSGKTVVSAEINDPTFSEEMLGKGMAIKPSEGKVYSPVDGVVDLVFDTKHAISITSKKGTEILIHVGLDTVSLKGEHFTTYVETGATVQKGDLLLSFDMEAIEHAGFDTIIPIVICNSDSYTDIVCYTDKEVTREDTIMELKK